jgi:hypothetical protein
MNLPVSTMQPVPLHIRFPNRYSGGYDSSIVTEKEKRKAQASTRRAPLNGNSASTTAAAKVYPYCFQQQK